MAAGKQGAGRAAATAFALLLARAGGASAEPPQRAEVPEVVVVGTTPVPGAGVDAQKVPSNVQRLDAEELRALRPVGLNDALNAKIGGVVVSDVQNNPLQPDVSFRGFTASPLLGVPQGLAIHQNGVRVNEPFGDTVQWDLVPEFAIDEVDVLPGANPVYGLNALGGAIALRMKDGFRYQGAHVSTAGGSFGRLRTLLESGGHQGDYAVYGAAEVMGEHGFRDRSPWISRRLYADVRKRTTEHETAISLTAANDELYGNGPAPADLLERRRASIYTYPDITDNRMAQLAVEDDSRLSKTLSLQATAYARRAARATLNADEADFAPCTTNPAVLCDDADTPLVSQRGGAVPRSAGGNGAVNTTRTTSTSFGGQLQATSSASAGAVPNQLAVGASVDYSPIDFTRESEVGALTQDRTIDGSGYRAQGELYRTDLAVRALGLGVYATDTVSLGPLSVTASGRLNAISLGLDDRGGTALDGSHDFLRVNPGVGAAWALAPRSSIYASYAESNRAPTAAELSCADPNAPCRVPNAFLSDPPLRQVVSRSAEVGVRGELSAGRTLRARYALGAFGSRNSDDIVFVAGSFVGTGYFRNAGTTQRVGLEAHVSGRVWRLRTFFRYQLLRATFESPFTLPSPNHPDAVLGATGVPVVRVAPGDTIPGMPVHTAKIGASFEPVRRLTVGATALVSSSQYYRGDESNQLSPVPGYAIVNASVGWEAMDRLTVFVDAKNVLGARYETFGVLGDATGVFPGTRDPHFLSPGAPFGIWAGVDVGFR